MTSCKTILFVDDDLKSSSAWPVQSYMLSYVNACRASGFAVKELTGIDEAIKHSSDLTSVDLAIIDSMMPPEGTIPDGLQGGMYAGFVVAQKFAKLYPELVIIILTNAYSVSQSSAFSSIRNVKAVLNKLDTSPEKLVGIIRMLIGGESAERLDRKIDADTNWRSVINAHKVATFEKFLLQPNELTPSEFLLLSELNQNVIKLMVDVVSSQEKPTSPWSAYTNQQLVVALPQQPNATVQGRILEELMLRLFNSVPGFEARSNIRTETEEIDIFILNGSNVAPWRDMGPALLCECKNWSSKCGTPEYSHFESKVRSRYGQCKCGFFVSWNGFTETFTTQRIRASRDGILIIEIESKHVEEALRSGSFHEVLRACWENAIAT
jgi:hypothetical protein